MVPFSLSDMRATALRESVRAGGGEKEVLGHEQHHIRCSYTSYLALSTPLVRRESSYMMTLALNLGTRPMAAKRRDWQARVKGILKGELKRRNLSYADLAEELAAVGVKDNERNISNKISRGTFT